MTMYYDVINSLSELGELPRIVGGHPLEITLLLSIYQAVTSGVCPRRQRVNVPVGDAKSTTKQRAAFFRVVSIIIASVKT